LEKIVGKRPISGDEPEFFFTACKTPKHVLQSIAFVASAAYPGFWRIASRTEDIKASIAGECAKARCRQDACF